MPELTLRAISHTTKGRNLSRENPITYEVLGLPPGQDIRIAHVDHCWQTLTTVDGVQGEWTGTYASLDDAMTAVEAERS